MCQLCIVCCCVIWDMSLSPFEAGGLILSVSGGKGGVLFTLCLLPSALARSFE